MLLLFGVAGKRLNQEQLRTLVASLQEYTGIHPRSAAAADVPSSNSSETLPEDDVSVASSQAHCMSRPVVSCSADAQSNDVQLDNSSCHSAMGSQFQMNYEGLRIKSPELRVIDANQRLVSNGANSETSISPLSDVNMPLEQANRRNVVQKAEKRRSARCGEDDTQALTAKKRAVSATKR